jgi:ribosomal protein S18 acetylase RimI-like enzyme
MHRFREAAKRPFVFAVEWIQSARVYRRLAIKCRPEIRISEASDADLRAVYAWFNPGQEQAPLSRSPDVTDFVAKHGTKIVGFVQLVSRPQSAGAHAGHWLYSLRVRLRYRGLGVAEDLCWKVIERARNAGAKQLSLIVVEGNHPAIALYRKLGFEPRTIPELERQFEEERLLLDQRRKVMSKPL